jgi:hypothetical protein
VCMQHGVRCPVPAWEVSGPGLWPQCLQPEGRKELLCLLRTTDMLQQCVRVLFFDLSQRTC